jgi:hypothetical protein
VEGISRDYPLKTRTSKQPIGEVPGYEIIPSHPLKYPRSKQGLSVMVYVSLAPFQSSVFETYASCNLAGASQDSNPILENTVFINLYAYHSHPAFRGFQTLIEIS